MRKALAALAATAGVALLVACSSPRPAPNPVACKAAMARAYATALRDPSAPPAAEPAACRGVPTATVSQYATQIMGGQG